MSDGRSSNGRRQGARVLIEAVEPRTLFSGGQLDPSFGDGGIATVTGLNAQFADVAPLPDGRILAFGFLAGTSSSSTLVVARFTYGGALDRTFAGRGYLLEPLTGSLNGVRGAVLPGGKFYVTTGGELDRFNADGARDATFGNGGVVALAGHSNTGLVGLAVQPDGKVLVTRSDIGVNRYTAAGAPDLTFGTGGQVTDLAGGTDWAFDQPADVTAQGGKILVAVTLNRTPLPFADPGAMGVERLNTDGSIDRMFGTRGVAGVPVPAQPRGIFAQRVRLAPDGAIFVGGSEGPGGVDLAVFAADGKPGYTAYGAVGHGPDDEGRLVPANGPYASTAFADVGFLADGSPVAVSQVALDASAPDAAYDFIAQAVRLNRDLTTDASFRQPVTEAWYPLPGQPAPANRHTLSVVGGAVDRYGRVLAVGELDGAAAVVRFYGTAATPVAKLGTDGVLRVGGGEGNDVIDVTRSGASVNVSFNGRFYGAVPAAAVKAVDVFARGGNDYVRVAAGAVPAYLAGDGGNDVLFGGAGYNILDGGAGDDVLTPGEGPGNFVRGGGGTDAVNYSHATRGVEVHLDGLQDSGHSGEHDTISSDITIVYGSQFNDVIFGNTLGSGAIHSALYGNGGNDTLIAGAGGDSLFGGDGDDLLLSRNSVKDVLDGGSGDNTAHIDTGLDLVIRIQHFQP